MRKAARGTASTIHIHIKTFGDIDLPQDNSINWKQFLQKLKLSNEKLNLLAKQYWNEHHPNQQNSISISNQNQDSNPNSDFLIQTFSDISDCKCEDLFAEFSDDQFCCHQFFCAKVGLDLDEKNDDMLFL